MDIVPESLVDMDLCLPWPMICGLACRSLVESRSLDLLVEDALRMYLTRNESR